MQVGHGVGVDGDPAGVGFEVAPVWGAHLDGSWGGHCGVVDGRWVLWGDRRGWMKLLDLSLCRRAGQKSMLWNWVGN